MTPQTTHGHTRCAARPAHPGRTRGASVGTWLRVARDLLRGWWERMRSRRQVRNLCELDDHILQDIGLTRAELLWEAEKPFWR
jgi:uncharacterized protein YjiS (DUF1127 family)